MIKQKPEQTIIYIMCPANYATGGPEALHQLAHELIQQNHETYMYYVHYNQDKKNSPIHPFYKKYNIPYVFEIENDKKNILLFPETFCTYLWDSRYTNIQKIVWWLSVTNFFISLEKIKKRYSKKNILKYLLCNYPIPTLKKVKNSDARHIAHSYFSLDFLQKNKFNVMGQISDYMNESFLEGNNYSKFKENIILYNPVKNGVFLEKIKLETTQYKWIAIQNMTPEEVSEVMRKAKLYIDFGYHPGKERMPREACLLDCCLIIGKDGSAKYKEDMPIKDEYHFDKNEKLYPKIIAKVIDCIENYPINILNFRPYKEVLLKEKIDFIKAVKKVFS